MCGDLGAEPSLVQANRLNPGEGAAETEAEALQQLVLNGIAGSSSARGDLNFAVDRGQVRVDSARADDQLLGYLRVGESFRYESKHLDFAGGEPIGIAG